MRVLFDHGTPRGLARFLAEHTVEEAKARGWDTLTNGSLLDELEQAGFEVLVTTDKNLRFQQNLQGRAFAIVALGTAQWPVLREHAELVRLAVNEAKPGSFTEVAIPA